MLQGDEEEAMTTGSSGRPARRRKGARAQAPVSASQDQTRSAFAFKWGQRETWDSPEMAAFTRKWLLAKYCDGDPSQLVAWLGPSGSTILDVGCGAAYSATALFEDLLRSHRYIGVDISDAVNIARQRFAELGYPGEFVQANLFDMPITDGSVDLIFSEGVLHHTDDTGAALAAVARKLRPGGRILFYVYGRKAPIREFVDDLVRDRLRPMTDAEAWEALKPLTRLGIAIGELGAEIDVPEEIGLLGIPAGRVDLQRLLYYNVMKAFYRPDFTFEAMHHINYDWYRPLNCHRHTEGEVRGFCKAAGLNIERLYAEQSGFAVVASVGIDRRPPRR
jgi:SAM-dependent methyltransferase